MPPQPLQILDNNSLPRKSLREMDELHITPRWEELTPDFFRGLSHLTSLVIGPQLSEIKMPAVRPCAAPESAPVLRSGFFRLLPNLRSLKILIKGIGVVARGAFKDLPRLESLSLEGNAIVIVEPGAFEGLDSLHTLSLERNRIERIHRGQFRGLRSLVKLDLNDNWIQSIESRAFAEVPNLASLDLRHNRIADLKKGVFWDIRQLGDLDLRSNPLRRLEALSFDGLQGCTQILLGGTQNFLSLPKDRLSSSFATAAR